jgi:hypothetical protein
MVKFIYTKLKFRSQTQLSPNISASCWMGPQPIAWIDLPHFDRNVPRKPRPVGGKLHLSQDQGPKFQGRTAMKEKRC